MFDEDELEPWEEIGWRGYSGWGECADRAADWAGEDVLDVVAYGPGLPEAIRPRNRQAPELWQPDGKPRVYRKVEPKEYQPKARDPLRLVVNAKSASFFKVAHIVPDPLYVPDGLQMCRNSIGPGSTEVTAEIVLANWDLRLCTLCLSKLRHSEALREKVVGVLKKLGFPKPGNWRDKEYGEWRA